MKPMKYGDHRERGGGLGMMFAAALVAVAGFSTGTSAQQLTTIYAFTGGADGGDPVFGSLIADAAGALYGTTQHGGTSGIGTVFKLTPSATTPWPETVLYSFSGSDGVNPVAGLLADAAGALYGTTNLGGAGNCFFGCGTVFKLTPSATTPWPETVLHSFSIGGGDGIQPTGDLIADAAGALYGTTSTGGASIFGMVFKLTPSATTPWPETVLQSFNSIDGANPIAGLIADASGALYGTTVGGGASDLGTVFKLMPSATTPWPETVLYSFSGSSAGDGAGPIAGLLADASGALYGTTLNGGASNIGTVFKLTPSATTPWPETVLYSFSGSSAGDGANPFAGLIADASGALYGTTRGGGASNLGTVFKLTPNEDGTYTETVLHSFSGGDGALPSAGLIADASGALYGTTPSGGTNGRGTVFKLTGSGFVPPGVFTGTPGTANCGGESISSLARTYGGIAHAAAALGFASAADLQNAVAAFCAG